MEAATHAALAEAERAGVAGNQITPFLLKRINELTGGASLLANIALVKVGTSECRPSRHRRAFSNPRLLS